MNNFKYYLDIVGQQPYPNYKDYTAEEWKEVCKMRQKLQDKAYILWYADLVRIFSKYTETQFNLMYGKAYEDGHSSGYDEIYHHMLELSSFVDSILETI